MADFLRNLFRVLNRDLTGETWEREMRHPYFGPMVYFGHREPEKSYWEAELSVHGHPKTFSVTMRGTPDGPEPSEESFCQATVGDLEALFSKCRDAFLGEYPHWTREPFPSDWKQAFVLDGFSVPTNGDSTASWDVCYLAVPTGHYFIAEFEAGRVVRVRVDG